MATDLLLNREPLFSHILNDGSSRNFGFSFLERLLNIILSLDNNQIFDLIHKDGEKNLNRFKIYNNSIRLLSLLVLFGINKLEFQQRVIMYLYRLSKSNMAVFVQIIQPLWKSLPKLHKKPTNPEMDVVEFLLENIRPEKLNYFFKNSLMSLVKTYGDQFVSLQCLPDGAEGAPSTPKNVVPINICSLDEDARYQINIHELNPESKVKVGNAGLKEFKPLKSSNGEGVEDLLENGGEFDENTFLEDEEKENVSSKIAPWIKERLHSILAAARGEVEFIKRTDISIEEKLARQSKRTFKTAATRSSAFKNLWFDQALPLLVSFIKARKHLRKPFDKLEKASKKIKKDLDSDFSKADGYMEISEEINDVYIQEKLNLEECLKVKSTIFIVFLNK